MTNFLVWDLGIGYFLDQLDQLEIRYSHIILFFHFLEEYDSVIIDLTRFLSII